MELLNNYPKASTDEAITGHHVPTSGWWRPTLNAEELRYMHQGDIFPPQGGARICWVLIESAHPSFIAGCEQEASSTMSITFSRTIINGIDT